MSSVFRRQWLLVISFSLLLALFTANGHPFLERDTDVGMNDDPAESQKLSLVERDADQREKNTINDEKNMAENVTSAPSIKQNRISTTKLSKNPAEINSDLKSNRSVAENRTNSNRTASPSVSITATKTILTGPITIQNSSVNIKSHQSIQNPSNSVNATHSSTLTNLLKPSVTLTPPAGTESNLLSSITPEVTHPSSVVVTRSGLLSSPITNGNKNKSVATAALAKAASTTSLRATSPVLIQDSLSSKTVSYPSVPSSESVALTISQKSPTASQASTQASTGSPNTQTSGVPSTINEVSTYTVSKQPTQLPSTEAPTTKTSGMSSTASGIAELSTHEVSTSASSEQPTSTELPSTKQHEVSSVFVTTKAPSTGSTKLPSTPEVSTSAGTETSAQPFTELQTTDKRTTMPLTTGEASSTSTMEVKTPTTTIRKTTQTSERPSTRATTETTRNPSTKATTPASKNPFQEVTAQVAERNPSTTPTTLTTRIPSTQSSSTQASTIRTEQNGNAKPKTSKPMLTNAHLMTKKPAAEDTKTKDENHGEQGRMPHPDQGREAVVWDFIVPVAIGTGVALAIAFGVILVRQCRRRKLIKVRFGGKPSHPRLLNNDLINLLAESDDEEE